MAGRLALVDSNLDPDRGADGGGESPAGTLRQAAPAILLYLSYFCCCPPARRRWRRGSLPALPGLYSVPLLFLLLFALPLNLVETRWRNRLRLRMKGGKA